MRRQIIETALLFSVLLVVGSPSRAAETSDTLRTVRAVVIEGNLTTKDFVILREMKLKPGEPLTAEALEHDRKRIYSLQLFNKVELDVQPAGTEATVVVRVDERWYLFPFPILGFRYRSLDNLYYGAGVVHSNFRGRNEKLFFSFALGFDRWVSLTYQNPKLTDDDVFLGVVTNYAKIRSQSVLTDYYDQTNLKFGVSLGKRFGLYQYLLGWVNYDLWNVSEPGSGRTVSRDGRDAFLSLGGSFAVDTRDLREYPTDGYYVLLFASKYGFGESAVNLFRYGVDLRVHRLLSEDLSLGARVFTNLAGGGIIPSYRHTYFGYDERIRGYFRTVLEGENILGSSVEWRIPLFKPRYYTLPFEFIPQFSVLRYGLNVGAFADAGTIWYRDQSFFRQRWYVGYGAGLHFLLPYSLVLRTEYARNTEGRGEILVDVGTSF
jgi:outer membrane protein assembly factor BamA